MKIDTIRLAFLCAAPTAATRVWRFPSNEPPDDKGLTRLRRRPPHLPPRAVWATCQSKSALETCRALSIAAQVTPALNDLDYGRWAGKDLTWVSENEPQALEAWLGDPCSAPHGGESIDYLYNRVASWLGELHTHKSIAKNGIVAVTHSTVIRAAVIYALDAPLASFWRVDVSPLSIVRLSGRSGRWNLTTLES